MVLEFIGADREVTGSCHYLTFGDTHVLIDCGMEQGADLYVNQERPGVAQRRALLHQQRGPALRPL